MLPCIDYCHFHATVMTSIISLFDSHPKKWLHIFFVPPKRSIFPRRSEAFIVKSTIKAHAKLPPVVVIMARGGGAKDIFIEKSCNYRHSIIRD